jgi:RimJ/RimL family protein N-acetyltransferase
VTSPASVKADYSPAAMDKWDPIAPVLEGTLVRVEPLDERHKAGLRAAGGDPAIWRWMPLDAGASDAQFERWWADAVEHNAARTEAVFVIVEREKDIVVGSTRYCALSPEHRALEIGWTWLAPAAWRSGINLETKLLLLGYAFEELGCIRVELKTDALNERSRAAIAGIGAQFEGIFRNNRIRADGTFRDSAYYSVIDSEWPGVAAALRGRLAAHAER